MATHPSILAWKIPWTEEPNELQSMGSQKSQTRLSTLRDTCVCARVHTHTHTHTHTRRTIQRKLLEMLERVRKTLKANIGSFGVWAFLDVVGWALGSLPLSPTP